MNRYQSTTRFNGQSTITLDGDRATGESYTIAHHLFCPSTPDARLAGELQRAEGNLAHYR